MKRAYLIPVALFVATSSGCSASDASAVSNNQAYTASDRPSVDVEWNIQGKKIAKQGADIDVTLTFKSPDRKSDWKESTLKPGANFVGLCKPGENGTDTCTTQVPVGFSSITDCAPAEISSEKMFSGSTPNVTILKSAKCSWSRPASGLFSRDRSGTFYLTIFRHKRDLATDRPDYYGDPAIWEDFLSLAFIAFDENGEAFDMNKVDSYKGTEATSYEMYNLGPTAQADATVGAPTFTP